MMNIIKDLFKMNRCLMGEGYDNALEYINHLIGLDIIEIPSGTKVGTWVVPQEWQVRDAWLKYNGRKILNYKKQPLSLMVGSLPFKKKVSLAELKYHLYVSDERPEAYPYEFKYYEKNWGLCMPKKKVDKLKKGKYEVFIDTKYIDGVMKIGVHTIKGNDREILLFAHLDHPFQANDNLSGVACLIDLAKRLKCEHTVKIIFCPETIGSIAYAMTQDISKVDFVMAVDIVSNPETLLVQNSFNEGDEINSITQLAVTGLGISFRKAVFRFLIGSDEYVFNDPKIGIPGILISRFKEELKGSRYHTSDDTPETVHEKEIKEVQKFIQEVIRIQEKNYVPELHFKGPLMRSRFGVQTVSKAFNRNLDYFIYLIDGKRSLIEICCMSGTGFDYAYDLLAKLKDEKLCSDNNKKGK